MISYFGSGIGSNAASMISSCANGFTRPEEVADLKAFIEAHKDTVNEYKRNVEQVVERAEGNIKWRELYLEEIVNWIEAQEDARKIL